MQSDQSQQPTHPWMPVDQIFGQNKVAEILLQPRILRAKKIEEE